MPDQPPEWANELELCRAWTQLPRSIPLQTTSGQSVDLIHLGIWTHGLGPDFRDALFSIDNGPVIAGSVELHLRSRGWTEHGHHLDPAYNTVALHIVGQFDPIEIRRADGKLVPTIVLDMATAGPPPSPLDWSLVGGAVCAEAIASSRAGEIRAVLGRLGDIRISARTAACEARLEIEPPDAVLYAMVLDAFGYAANREGMRLVGQAVPWRVLASILTRERDAFTTVAALLLGAGGYLPFSDTEAGKTGLSMDLVTGINAKWPDLRAMYAIDPIPATTWQLARIRPSNHPALRLVQAAALIASSSGQLSSALLEPVREQIDPTAAIAALVSAHGSLRLGEDRARAIATNVVLPFSFALANHSGDRFLAAQAGEHWESLPGAESNERTRRATRQISGDTGIRKQGARIQQGLIHLDRTLCEPRRCFECPIAAMVVMDSASEPNVQRLG